MSSAYHRTGRPRHTDVLTPAEWDVLAGVRKDLSNREIADDRGCGIETVRFHLRSVRRKLGVRSRDELRAFPGRPAVVLERERAQRPGRWIREQIPLIATRDMGRALDFYVAALGFEVVARWPDAEGTPGWAALGAGAARIMLHAGHHQREVDFENKGGTVTLSLHVEGLDVFRRDLLSAGYSCGKPATGGGRP